MTRSTCRYWAFGFQESLTSLLIICRICLIRWAGQPLADGWEQAAVFDLRNRLEVRVGTRRSNLQRNKIADNYERWCSSNGGLAFPVSYSSLSGFFCSLVVARGGSSRSIANDLGAIGRRARDMDSPWLKQSEELKLKDLIAAMKYEDTSGVERKRPLQLKHLLPAISSWDLSDCSSWRKQSFC